jgi:hypothetical protein
MPAYALDRLRQPRRCAVTQNSDHIRVALRSFVSEQTFVYAFVCKDSFKIGHSGDPLRRLVDFDPRYYETFALSESRVLAWPSREQARAHEKQIHKLLKPYNVDPPRGMPGGGSTEWFSRSALHLINDLLPNATPLLPLVTRCLVERKEHYAQIITRCIHDVLAREAARGYYSGTKIETDIFDIIDAYAYFNISLSAVISADVLTLCFNQKVRSAINDAIQIERTLERAAKSVVHQQLQYNTIYKPIHEWTPSPRPPRKRKHAARPEPFTQEQKDLLAKARACVDAIDYASNTKRNGPLYSDTLKALVVALVDGGLSYSSVARELNLIDTTVTVWVKKARQAKLSSQQQPQMATPRCADSHTAKGEPSGS